MITTEKIPFICAFCGKSTKSIIIIRVLWKKNKKGRLEPYPTGKKDATKIREWERDNIIKHLSECSVPISEKAIQVYEENYKERF